MDYRLDYITRVFTKIKSKPLEHYVITRIWHMLDDIEVKIVPQQYVNRTDQKYALTDLYFPQIKLHVEINEPAHYLTEERIINDRVRRDEISISTNHRIEEIDCRGTHEEINERIDKLVRSIKKEIAAQRDSQSFQPWRPDYEFSVKYYKNKSLLKAEDDVQLRTIEEICDLFDAPFKKRGFLMPGVAVHPKKENVLLWWPSTKKRSGWINSISQDENTIIETHENEDRRHNHVVSELNSPKIERFVFFHHRDNLGMTTYRFKGIYRLNAKESNTEKGIVWSRISNVVELNSELD